MGRLAHRPPFTLAYLVASCLLACCAMAAPPRAPAEKHTVKRQFVAVVGFKTISATDDSGWIGAGLGEELATRLNLDKEHFEALERLQVNNVLTARGAAKSMLEIGGAAPDTPEARAEATTCAQAISQAVRDQKLWGADLLILGSVIASDGSLAAETHLVDVSTGQVGTKVRVKADLDGKGVEAALQRLSVELALGWCEKLGGQAQPEMSRTGSDKPDLYRSWCQAQEALLRGDYRGCLAKVAGSERSTTNLNLLAELMEARDQAYEMLWQDTSGSEQAKLAAKMLSTTKSTYEMARQGFAVAAFYYGRALERAGRLADAEAKYRECLKQRPGRLLWDVETGEPVKAIPIVSGGVVCTASDTVLMGPRHLHAFEAKTGKAIWEFRSGDAIYSPVVVDGVAYVGSHYGDLRALRVKTGECLWAFDAPESLYAPVVEDGVVYVDSLQGHFRALNARTGELLWEYDRGVGCASPVVADDVAYTTTCDELRAFDAKTGKLLWRFEAGDAIAPPVVVEGVAYTCSTDGFLRALEAKTGRLKWEVKANGCTEAPAVVGGVAYTGSYNGHLRAFEATTGELLWDFVDKGDVQVPTLSNGVAYMASWTGHLRAFEARTGRPLWDVEAIGIKAPVVIDDVAYVEQCSGLQALEPATGKQLWACGAGDLDQTPVVVDGVAYGVDGDRLRAFGAKTGEPQWDFEAGSNVSTPVVVNGVAYAGSDDGHLRAFDATPSPGPDYAELCTARLMRLLARTDRNMEALRLGARLWRETPGRAPETRRAMAGAALAARSAPASTWAGLQARFASAAPTAGLVWDAEPRDGTFIEISDGVVYATSFGGGIEASEAATGRLLWNFKANGFMNTWRVAEGVVCVATDQRHLQALAEKTGKLLWRSQDGAFMNLKVVDGVVYAGCFDYYVPEYGKMDKAPVWAFDAKTGKLLWQFEAGGPIRNVVVAAGIAYMDSEDKHLRAFEAKTGKLLWDFLAPSFIHTPVVANGVAYAGSIDGHLVAFDAETGISLWEFAGRDPICYPAVVDGVVYAGSWDGHLRAFDAKTGMLLWDASAGKDVKVSIVTNGVAYAIDEGASASDGHLWAFETGTGTILWEFKAGGWLDLTAVVDGVAYTESDDHYLRAFAAKTGELLWEFRGGDRVNAEIVGGVAYVATWYGLDHHLRALAAQTGELLWEFEAGTTGIAKHVLDGVAYTCASDGHLRAFDLDKAKTAPRPETTWGTETQFWSCVIWGKGGLAVRKMAEGYALSQVLRYDAWPSGDALAAEIDRLAKLAEAPSGQGDWGGPLALSLDPATLCPPELKPAIRADLTAQGVSRAAQFYLQVAKQDGAVRYRIEYAREALRLAPEWDEAQKTVQSLKQKEQ